MIAAINHIVNIKHYRTFTYVGTIEAVHWTDQDSNEGISGNAVSEGMQGRVIGSVR